MKLFSEPEIEIYKLKVEDIITTSVDELPDDLENGMGWG